MIIKIELGVPYHEIMQKDELFIEISFEHTIKTLIEKLLTDNPCFMEKVKKRGYFVDGKLKAIYTKNSVLVDSSETLKDGDVLKIIAPIIGG